MLIYVGSKAVRQALFLGECQGHSTSIICIIHLGSIQISLSHVYNADFECAFNFCRLCGHCICLAWRMRLSLTQMKCWES